MAASTPAQYSSRLPVPFVFDISVKARPWLTANELNPFVRDAFVQTTKPGLLVAHVVEMGSGEMPSVVGPRYWGQSVARASACPSNSIASATPVRTLPDLGAVASLIGPRRTAYQSPLSP